MKAKNLESAVADLDQCLIAYIEQRRSHIEAFVAQHFSLRETFRIQKKSFLLDLLVNPINTAWSIPYLSIRKLTEAIEKLGWNNAADFLKLIPSGIKTHYQKEIERLVATELLDFQLQGNSGLIEKLKDQEAVDLIKISEAEIRSEFKIEIDKFSSAQAMMTDLTGSVLTIVAGWMFFNDRSLGIMGIGHRIAQRIAQRRAASHFFLGNDLGSAFYKALPPTPTSKDLWVATGLALLLLTLLSLLVSLMIDPFRKKWGLQQKRFHIFLDQLEQCLFLYIKRKNKEARAQSLRDQ